MIVQFPSKEVLECFTVQPIFYIYMDPPSGMYSIVVDEVVAIDSLII